MSLPPLRRWQKQALQSWSEHRSRDFLVHATPGSGKTTFALAAARHALTAGSASQLVVVCPTGHLRTQWADAAAAAGIPIDPEFSNSAGVTSSEFCGVAVTYQQVAANPDVHAKGVSGRGTFVILDELHHAGNDTTWGGALTHAYRKAGNRLSLTGTPWRSDDNPIPFINYLPGGDGILRSAADYTYGYEDALADRVVRPAVFYSYNGQAIWTDSEHAPTTVALTDRLTHTDLRKAWRAALDPDGPWIRQVLTDANIRLRATRKQHPECGGLVIASNQRHARSYARTLQAITGKHVPVATSDNPDSGDVISKFRDSAEPWLVSVRQVSEGVDIPRLGVLVYATNIATPLFFTQAVGRVIRYRAGQAATASVFIPSVRPVVDLASNLEQSRRHVLGDTTPNEQDLVDNAGKVRTEAGAQTAGTFRSGSGSLDRLIYSGTELAGDGNDTWLTLPGMLDVDDLFTAAHRAQHTSGRQSGQETEGEEPLHRKVTAARRELNAAVGAIHHSTGLPHGTIHAQLRRQCGGPASAAATLAELKARAAQARTWA